MACALLGLRCIGRGNRRTARDVADDLKGLGSADDGAPWLPEDESGGRRSQVVKSLALVGGGGGGALIGLSFGRSGSEVIVLGGVALALGYVAMKAHERRLIERRRRAIDFHLPLVMESIVMAVEAGADIVGAIRRVVESSAIGSDGKAADPVTTLLRAVIEQTDAGGGLEETLRDVAARSDAITIRHAFSHLALAHREGGEIIRPLRELGNSTQLYYQETIEEEIAQLPVKATVPLLCTFTGLIVCFITVPLLQVSSLTKRALPSGEASPIGGERGAMTLFLTFCIVPILFLLGTLALDLRSYALESGARQRILDEAVLEGVRALPRSERAIEVARAYLHRFGLGDEVEVRATSRSVSALHEGRMSLSFPRLVGLETVVPFTLYARARSRPVDAVIALDLGRDLSPAAGAQWGSANEWGAAEYFIEQAKRFRSPPDPAALTARCFNPIVSPLKLGAIWVHDYLAAFGDTQIGVGIYPGNGYDLEFVRPFSEFELGRISFPRYEGREVRSEDCAQMALGERWFERYRFPTPRYGELTVSNEPMFTPSGEFNQSYGANLTVREAIWMSPVREESPSGPGLGDLPAVLEGVLEALIGAPSVAERGGLEIRPRRFGVIFSGNLPHVGTERFPSPIVKERLDAVFDRYRAVVESVGSHIRVYLVILTPPTMDLDSLAQAAVRRFFTERNMATAAASLEIEPLFARDGDALLSSVVPALLLDRSAGGLAR